jgi:hypothetical protein
MTYSLTGTGIAVALFVLAGNGTSDSGLRVLGASAGAALALVAVVLGVCRRDAGVRWDEAAQTSIAPRFFAERRRTPRRASRRPVQLAVNGRTCDAVVLCVSANGALLRLRGAAGRELRADVGQPVRIDDQPAGRLARIGAHGAYVDFAIEFDAASVDAEGTPVGSSLV